MTPYSRPIQGIIRQRRSCRNYLEQPLAAETIRAVEDFLAEERSTPFGARARFRVFAAHPGFGEELKGLGTYGVIRSPQAFIVGAMDGSARNLEDYGYLMEKNILYVTELGLGSCWIGGSFKQSSYERKMGLEEGESVPAVASMGVPASGATLIDRLIRWRVASHSRKPEGELFFDGDLSRPLAMQDAGPYREALEMVRLAPSASNLQPWRIVKDGGVFHFFVQKSEKYQRSLRLRNKADLQRIDAGIALCHFELTAAALALRGDWRGVEQAVTLPNDQCEYLVSWVGK